MTAYAQLMKSMWTGNIGPVIPQHFKNIIDKYDRNFPIMKQHDSQEFLQFLLNHIHEELENNDDSVIVQLFQVCLIIAFNGYLIYGI